MYMKLPNPPVSPYVGNWNINLFRGWLLNVFFWMLWTMKARVAVFFGFSNFRKWNRDFPTAFLISLFHNPSGYNLWWRSKHIRGSPHSIAIRDVNKGWFNPRPRRAQVSSHVRSNPNGQGKISLPQILRFPRRIFGTKTPRRRGRFRRPLSGRWFRPSSSSSTCGCPEWRGSLIGFVKINWVTVFWWNFHYTRLWGDRSPSPSGALVAPFIGKLSPINFRDGWGLTFGFETVRNNPISSFAGVGRGGKACVRCVSAEMLHFKFGIETREKRKRHRTVRKRVFAELSFMLMMEFGRKERGKSVVFLWKKLPGFFLLCLEKRKTFSFDV